MKGASCPVQAAGLSTHLLLATTIREDHSVRERRSAQETVPLKIIIQCRSRRKDLTSTSAVMGTRPLCVPGIWIPKSHSAGIGEASLITSAPISFGTHLRQSCAHLVVPETAWLSLVRYSWGWPSGGSVSTVLGDATFETHKIP